MNLKVDKRLHQRELFNIVKEEMVSMLGVPEVKDLSKTELLFSKIVEKKLSKISGKNKSNGKNHHLSAWGILTELILKGHGKRSAFECIRFGHFEIMEGILDANENTLKKAFCTTFSTENAFPWINPEAVDIRLSKANTSNPAYFCLTEANNIKIHYSNNPIIVFSRTTSEQEQLFLREALTKRPFVILLKQYNAETLDKMYVLGHILCNHEYLDGVTAAYYLHLFLKKLNLEEVALRNVSSSILSSILHEADTREHITGSDKFNVRSFLLDEHTTQKITVLYENLLNSLKAHQVNINFETFLHLLLFSLYAKNKLNGCTLKFSFNIKQQLDFYRVDELIDVVKSILENPDHIQRLNNGWLHKGNVSLYKKENAVISSLLSPVILSMPLIKIRIVNKISEISGFSKKMIGNIVVTSVPCFIQHQDKKITLGNGFGGPTLAPFQDAAFTFGVIYDAFNTPQRLIIRRKFKKETVSK